MAAAGPPPPFSPGFILVGGLGKVRVVNYCHRWCEMLERMKMGGGGGLKRGAAWFLDSRGLSSADSG